jgi:NIMA-interacting peptidyl-prolyl cis-trans isomerase 1
MPFQPPEWAGLSPGQLSWAVEGLTGAPWPISEKGFYLIGRSADPQHQIDIVLGDDEVSTRHAVLCHHKEHNILYLIDLSSRTGTRLDGSKIAPNKPTKVGNGSVIEVGPYTLRCTRSGAPSGAPSASISPEKLPSDAKVRASHLLVKHCGSRNPSSWKEPTITRSEDEAFEMVEAYRRRIVAGESFAELAATASDCSSAKRGGDLGPFGRGMMQREFEEATYALQVGELSQPVFTASGIHIILRTA